jgi:probable F420-dependent oxidoreductase
MPQPFRFSLQTSRAGSATEWRDKARQAEDLGYSTLHVPDHFVDCPLAVVPALMAAAEATTTLRVGSLVFDNDYKHPVVLAKECATIDLLSDGRLELGLGAGWMRVDYDAAGMPYDEPAVRVERMEEGLRIIKGLMAEGPFSFAGRHYTVTELDGAPLPVQRPHPPILIGGGSKRVLAIAAREAQIVGINPSLRAGEVGVDAARSALREATLRKVEWVREAAGERFPAIELHCLTAVVQFTDDPMGVAEGMAGYFGITPAEALDVPMVLAGTVESMCETLIARRELYGFSYVSIHDDVLEPFAEVVARLAGT